MAIYTRFGTPVEVVEVIDDTFVRVFAEYESGPAAELNVPILELKADGGLAEIQTAIKGG